MNVTGIAQDKGRVTGVVTDGGAIRAEYVVNCAGMWGREVGRMAGVNVPLQACEHFYVVTEANPEIPRNLPVLRVPDECAYYKEDAGKLLVGFFEPKAKPWGVDGIPEDAHFLSLPDDWEHIAPELEKAMARVPLLARTGIHTFFNGPESFTPDDRYLLGEAPELRNFFVAAGFNSIGIQSAGGAGMALAQWMAEGEPPFDLGDVDIRRMFPFQGNKTYLVNRATETLGLLYADHFPYRHYETARGVRHTPLHERLAERGACFGEAAGWERPFWFLPPEAKRAAKRRHTATAGSARTGSTTRGRATCAVREGVGLFDMTPFGKIRVEGPDAEAVLQRISANDVAVRAGPHRLYAVAERPRRYRGRPHRHAAVGNRVPGCDRLGDAAARLALAQAAYAGRGALRGDRRDERRSVSRRHGPTLARAAAATRRRGSVERGLSVRDGADHRDRHGARARAIASPTSASSAGRSTCRPTWHATCSIRSWRAAMASA